MAVKRTEHGQSYPFLLGQTCLMLGLGTKVMSDLELANLVSRGLPHGSIKSLAEHGIPEQHIFRFIIPRRRYHRRRDSETKLTPEESDRAARVARLLALATLVFDDGELAARWLGTPKRQFGSRVALELLASSIGARVVEESLLRAYYGYAA